MKCWAIWHMHVTDRRTDTYGIAHTVLQTILWAKNWPTISLSELGMSLNSFLKSLCRDLYVGLSICHKHGSKLQASTPQSIPEKESNGTNGTIYQRITGTYPLYHKTNIIKTLKVTSKHSPQPAPTATSPTGLICPWSTDSHHPMQWYVC